MSWFGSACEEDQVCFLDRSREHGIQPLLYFKLTESHSRAYWPDTIVSSLHRETLLQAAFKANLEIELDRILAGLNASGVHPLIFKGAAPAYTHYPAPYLRPHSDVDLWITKRDLESLTSIMRDLGYSESTLIRSDLVSNQVLFTRADGRGFGLELDFHWKLSNRYLLSNCLSFEEICQKSVAIPAFGVHALAPNPVHALLIACIHRIAHHLDVQKLIWIYDIHLLANSLSWDLSSEFQEAAAAQKVLSICRDGVALARRYFSKDLPCGLLDGLLVRQEKVSAEPSARYIGSKLGRAHIFLLDLRDMPWPLRMNLIRDVFFPSPQQLRNLYGISGSLCLPLLYMRRAMSVFRTLWINVRRHSQNRSGHRDS